ncbi:MAG: APC family permease [Saprospirales bacterium]|nr:APC family permease [Saprospirales bacterium]MBK8489863.1 APC family permease [Saprospirales bacterium]
MEAPSPSALRKTLGLRDLLLLNVTAVFGLGSLANAAQFGLPSLTLWVVALVIFMIPFGLTVVELHARLPGEGGLYLWTKEAFGDRHGFVVGWSYWLCNIVWFPTVMLTVSTVFLYVGGSEWLGLTENSWYNGVFSLGLLWLIVLLNILGLEKAKWIQNIGGVALWVTMLLLLGLGIFYLLRYGSAREVSAGKFLPDLTDFKVLPFFATITFAFAGLELAPILSGEARNPNRDIPRALFLAGFLITFLYFSATAILLLTLPENEVRIMQGVAQSFAAIGGRLGYPLVGVVGAGFMTLALVGSFGAWMTGTARVPFVIGIDRFLPEALGKVHPRWGSPYVSLLVQGGVVTVLFLGSLLGSTVKEAYLILLDMSIILYFIPFLYMFASLVVHRYKNAPPGKRWSAWWVAAPGFLVTLFSVILSAVPSKEVEHKELFVLKVVGGAALLILVGLGGYFFQKKQLDKK